MSDETEGPLREDWLREKIEHLADTFDLAATEFDSIGEPSLIRTVTYNETVAEILRAALSTAWGAGGQCRARCTIYDEESGDAGDSWICSAPLRGGRCSTHGTLVTEELQRAPRSEDGKGTP